MALNVRHPGPKFVHRYENEWPLARTQWTKFYLDLKNKALSRNPSREKQPSSMTAWVRA